MFITLVNMTRVHLRKVKQFSYPKKLIFATSEPIYKKEVYPSSQHCSNLKPKAQSRVHPYTQLLADEFINYLQTSPFVVYFHLNSLSRHQYRQSRNAFIKKGFMLERYDHEVAEVALKGTRFEILTSFYQTDAMNAVAFGTKIDVKAILALEKSLSTFFTLLFAIFENRIISKEQLIEYRNLPSINVLHQTIVQTLTLSTLDLSSRLSHHTQQLSNHLESYSKG